MPRPARPWFRFYVEAMRDPKMHRLTPAQRWLWVAILAAARESPEPGTLLIARDESMTMADLSRFGGVDVRVVRRGISVMEGLGMVHINAGVISVPAWSDRQYESDDVTARTRKHRSREQVRNVPTTFPGTPPETETETETEKPLTPPSPNSDKRADPAYGFEDFWTAYPKRNGRRVGRGQALVRWKRLTYDDKVAAFGGVEHYRSDCDAERTIAKDAARWLRDRCWEDWQDEADPTRSLSKQERRIVDRGHVEGFLEAVNGNGIPRAITTGSTT